MQEKRSSGVSAIVLAAGRSTRLGSPKQLLQIGGQSLLASALETLRRSQIEEIVVVLGASADIIRQQVVLDGAKAIINDQYREGMGTSLRVLAAIIQVSLRVEF